MTREEKVASLCKRLYDLLSDPDSRLLSTYGVVRRALARELYEELEKVMDTEDLIETSDRLMAMPELREWFRTKAMILSKES